MKYPKWAKIPLRRVPYSVLNERVKEEKEERGEEGCRGRKGDKAIVYMKHLQYISVY